VTPTQEDLQPIVNEAVARWADAGLAVQSVHAMTKTKFVLADLPGAQVGFAAADVIYLDPTAAGFGWFVDQTPSRDEEFTRIGIDGQLAAIGSQPMDRIDLLTVVEHELGHVVGLRDLDAEGTSLMSGLLGKGVRRLTSIREIDAVFTEYASLDDKFTQ
jgi:hypothetical protein